MGSKLPKWEKEPHYHLQLRECRDNAISTPILLCLVYHKLLGPFLHWQLLSSLHVERKSSLSERMEQYLPKLSGMSTLLENTYALNFSMLLVSITCMVLSASLLLRNGDNKTRALTTMITLLLLALAGTQWGRLGGSALEYFMLYMPFTLSIGCSLGHASRHRKGGCMARLNQGALLTTSRPKDGIGERAMVLACEDCSTPKKGRTSLDPRSV